MVLSVAFSLDLTHILFGTADGKVEVWPGSGGYGMTNRVAFSLRT